MPNTVHYILLNGPKHSGKTTIAAELMRCFRELQVYAVQDAFAAPMKHFVAAGLGEKYAEMNKEKARAELCGYSVREFNFDVAENYIKDRYGEDVFARWLVHRTLRLMPLPQYVIVDDVGFDVEILNAPHTLVRVIRNGTTFYGSGSYITGAGWVFDNNGDMASLRAIAKSGAAWIVNGKPKDEII